MSIISRFPYAYLHGLVKVEDLVLGLGLQEIEPGVQLLGSLVDVSDDLTLVLLDLLADLLQEGDAVAGRVPIPEKMSHFI
jgi:hypothetical protein